MPLLQCLDVLATPHLIVLIEVKELRDARLEDHLDDVVLVALVLAGWGQHVRQCGHGFRLFSSGQRRQDFGDRLTLLGRSGDILWKLVPPDQGFQGSDFIEGALVADIVVVPAGNLEISLLEGLLTRVELNGLDVIFVECELSASHNRRLSCARFDFVAVVLDIHSGVVVGYAISRVSLDERVHLIERTKQCRLSGLVLPDEARNLADVERLRILDAPKRA